ncbi:MAG: ABC transporter permease [Burkholderiales bacterium]
MSKESAKVVEYGKPKMTFSRFILDKNIYIIFVLLFIVASLISPVFLTFNNMINILRQQCAYIAIGMGLLMVMVTGNIDLSVTSTAALGSVVLAHVIVTLEGSVILGLLAALLSCCLIGALNGVLVSYLKMPSFVVTLAMGFGVQGLAYIIPNGASVTIAPTTEEIAVLTTFGQKSDPLLNVPYQIYLIAVVVLILSLVMKFTSYGRLSLAIGSNENATVVAGINTKVYKLCAFIICGLLSGLAGILIATGNGSASPITSSGDYTMVAIAGTVIGGTNLDGGEGAPFKSVVGVLVIGLIGNIMNLTHVPPYNQMVVRAMLIILAVLLRSVTSKSKG